MSVKFKISRTRVSMYGLMACASDRFTVSRLGCLRGSRTLAILNMSKSALVAALAAIGTIENAADASTYPRLGYMLNEICIAWSGEGRRGQGRHGRSFRKANIAMASRKVRKAQNTALERRSK